MIPESLLTPSPEEQIIRQRSRIALFEKEGTVLSIEFNLNVKSCIDCFMVYF